MSIMTRLDLVQITVQQSAKRVADAQEKYNQTLLEFGSGSKQAIAANRELESAQAANEKAALRARMSYVLIAGDLLTMAVRLPQVVSGIQAMSVASIAAARNLTAMQIAGGAAVAALSAFVILAATMNGEMERGSTAAEELALAKEALEAEGSNPTPFTGPILGGIEKLMGMVPGVTTDMEAYEAAVKRVADAEEAVAQERHFDNLRKTAQAAIDAAKATAELEQKNNALAASMRQGFGNLGIQVNAFSQGFQEDLLLASGVSAEFIATLRPLVDAESLLKTATGETGKALRAQAEITAHKDETTEDFIARLKDLGFTEEDIKARVDETGRALLSQAAATRAASNATARASGGSGGVADGDLLAATLNANKDEFMTRLLGVQPGSRATADAGQWFDASRILSTISGNTSDVGVAGGVATFTGDVGSDLRSRATSIIADIAVQNLNSTRWDAALSRLNVSGAQQAGGKTVVIQPGAMVLNGRQADGLMRELQRLGVSG